MSTISSWAGLDEGHAYLLIICCEVLQQILCFFFRSVIDADFFGNLWLVLHMIPQPVIVCAGSVDLGLFFFVQLANEPGLW